MKFRTVYQLRRAVYLKARQRGADTKEASAIAETAKENAIRNPDATWSMEIKDTK